MMEICVDSGSVSTWDFGLEEKLEENPKSGKMRNRK
jgi:hypothetical protein